MNISVTTIPITFLFFLPVFVYAATAVVIVDTGSAEINALEGIVALPDAVDIETVSAGSSAISLWVLSPSVEKQHISFSGVTPGGFSGSHQLFTLTGDFTADDLTRTSFESVRALKNDGVGTEVPVTMTIALAPAILDTQPPEEFIPEVAHDPNIFNGEHFLVFTTQDKGSGIAHYYVREGILGSWVEAESPYLLKNQRLTQTTYVKAVDNAGNERIITIGHHRGMWWVYADIFVILIILALVIFVCRRLWLRFIQ